MKFEVDQIWSSNLPGHPWLRITSVSSELQFMFPILLVDDLTGATYCASTDGFLQHVLSPMGYSYKLVILVSKEKLAPKLIKDRQVTMAKKQRDERNKRILRANRLTKDTK